jgi:hypothetical protein
MTLMQPDGRLLERAAGMAAAAGSNWEAAEAHFTTTLEQAETLPTAPSRPTPGGSPPPCSSGAMAPATANTPAGSSPRPRRSTATWGCRSTWRWRKHGHDGEEP